MVKKALFVILTLWCRGIFPEESDISTWLKEGIVQGYCLENEEFEQNELRNEKILAYLKEHPGQALKAARSLIKEYSGNCYNVYSVLYLHVTPEFEDLFLEKLNEPDFNISPSASHVITYLAKLKSKRAVPGLLRCYRNLGWKRTVAAAMGMIGDPEGNRKIAELVQKDALIPDNVYDTSCHKLLKGELQTFNGLTSETLQMLKQWDPPPLNYEKPTEKHVVYRKILAMKDGDLVFLLGLFHQKDPVRRLSKTGLAFLKTDRSFNELVKGLKDRNIFVREKCIEALGRFKQERCIKPLLYSLRNDPLYQNRVAAACGLEYFNRPEVCAAFMNILRRGEWDVGMAAGCLGRMQYKEAIPLIYQVIKKSGNSSDREELATGLTRFHTKEAALLVLDLLGKAPGAGKPEDEQDCYSFRLEDYFHDIAKKYTEYLGPPPDTYEQHREWWGRAAAVLDENLKLREKYKIRDDYRDEDFETDISRISMTIDVYPKHLRVGDPIRLDVELRNNSSKPFKIVKPFFDLCPWSVDFVQTEFRKQTLFRGELKGMSEGSYFGPPPFDILLPGQSFKNSTCLQNWLPFHRKPGWPPGVGVYELSLGFDSSKYGGIKAERGARRGKWTSNRVRFSVCGEVRRDPDDVLDAVVRASGNRWLKSDLLSRRGGRREKAWYQLTLYGDDRLLHALKKLVTPEDFEFDMFGLYFREFPRDEEPEEPALFLNWKVKMKI